MKAKVSLSTPGYCPDNFGLIDSLRYLKGVGPKIEGLLRRLKVYSLKGLFYYFPVRYQDRREIIPISKLKEGHPSLIRAKIAAVNLRATRRTFFKRKNLFEAILSDGSGSIESVWFNQPYLREYIKAGDTLLIFGKPVRYKGKIQFNAPEYEIINGEEMVNSLNFGRITGFYRLTEGLTQKRIRKIIFETLERYASKMEDVLPFYIRQEKGFPNITCSLKNIHFPSTFEDADLARKRLIFEELFFSQIMVYLRKAKRVLTTGIEFKIETSFIQEIKEKFNFAFTRSQEESASRILRNMTKPHPMHCLLQGDVGSGKTAVAILAIGACAKSNFQVSFMVPTEILAYQHYQTLVNILKDFEFKIDILVSNISKGNRLRIIEGLKKGKIDIIVGTHSLLEEDVEFKHLGLVVIDEQHKFGVAQRALLPQKGINPDCLVMSATPIPRSLALSIYGDLDLSVIRELPPQRKEPKTILAGEKKRAWVYEFVRNKLREGRQAYIVYPVIEESKNQDLHSLEEMYFKLKEVFKEFSVEMFHGRLKKEEKQKVVNDFRRNKINLLVSTTVIEVGVDIENVTTMVVENPERFGLAQLHQLRGRIRRSKFEPNFILIAPEDLSDNAGERLRAIAKINDGFKISEEDLKLRGPGDFFGHFQWGFPEMKIANPLSDLDILTQARRAAYEVIKVDPNLEKPQNKSIRRYLGPLLRNK